MILDIEIEENIDAWKLKLQELSTMFIDKKERGISSSCEQSKKTLLIFGIDIMTDIINTYRYLSEKQIVEIINYINLKV